MSNELENEKRFMRIELWVKNHDKVCAERWSFLVRLVGWGGALFGTAILSVLGWSLGQIHADQNKQIEMIQHLQSNPPQITIARPN